MNLRPSYDDGKGIVIYQGDAREVLPQLEAESVNCCVTSPPYWGLRDYGVEGQLGLERTPEEYIAQMVEVFRGVKRALRDDGTLWLNIGDSYHSGDRGGYRNDSHRWENCPMQSQATGSHLEAVSPNRLPQQGLKDKDLCGIPWMLAFALRADGWYLRSDIIWSKPNPMPESVTDRPTKAHEYIFLLSKSSSYYYDAQAIAEKANWPEGSWSRSKCYDGDETGKLRSFYGNGARWEGGETRNKRTVWKADENISRSAHMERTPRNDGDRWRMADGGVAPRGERNKHSVWEVATQPFPEAHFATFPEELIKPCILAGCPAGGTVLDPFMGSGTTALVARGLQCKAVGIEVNPAYIEITAKRLAQEVFSF